MSLVSWLRIWKRSDPGQGRGARGAPRQRASFRPRLEALEDRTLLSVYTAATVSDLIADINAANQAGGANTITLTAPTTSPYVLTAVNNTTNGAKGLPVLSGGGKKVAADNLTIVGNGDTIERSTAAGTATFRLFDVASGSSLTLENVTLQNGLAFGSGAAADGGAIYNQGTLTLIDTTVQGNTAQGSNGADGVLRNNHQSIPAQAGANAAGGGIWSSGAVTLEGASTIQGNQALGGQGGAAVNGVSAGAGGGGFGGGLYEAGGSVSATNATVAGNTARGGAGGDDLPAAELGVTFGGIGGGGSGGGLYVASGTLSMSSVLVQGNQAAGGAGGTAFEFPMPGGDGSGGGIYVAGGTATLAAVNLLSNTAVGGQGGGNVNSSGAQGGNGFGGGLYAGGGTVTLTSDTVTGNQAEGGDSGFNGFPTTPDPGAGEGGGLYILPTASLCLDTATLDAILNNIASTSDPNIHGPYSMC